METEKIELKPCPFCGGEMRMCQSNIGGAQILCAECGCGTQYSYKKLEHAIAAWNRRTPSDHIVAANKKVDDNPPLTLEELRDMGGEPVWIEDWWQDFHGWELSDDAEDYCAERDTKQYGTLWRAYRRKPEEVAK